MVNTRLITAGPRMRLGMRCRLSPTADVPSHTSGAAMCHEEICAEICAILARANRLDLSTRNSSPVSWRYSRHVDAHPARRVPSVEAGIDLVECRFRRHARRRLLCYRVRPRVLRVAAPRCPVPPRFLGTRHLQHGLRGDPPAVDPHFVGAGLRHRGPDQRLPGADLGWDHGGNAADAAADPGAADTHATSASLCGT